jgi:hypothetical protein
MYLHDSCHFVSLLESPHKRRESFQLRKLVSDGRQILTNWAKGNSNVLLTNGNLEQMLKATYTLRTIFGIVFDMLCRTFHRYNAQRPPSRLRCIQSE